MLTAIGLCVLIMLMHLVPAVQDGTLRLPTSVTASAR